MRVFGIALLLFATLQFGFRGAQRVRSEIPMWDFASVYSASRTWIHGGDPYDRDSVMATWKSSGSFADRDASYFATVYPPSSLLLLVPFALLPVKLSMASWLALSVVLLGIQFTLLIRMAGLHWRDPRSTVLLGASLAAAPYQFGLLSGQLSVPAIALSVVACFVASQNRNILAGILLGAVCALKPQVGAPFLAYFVLRRRPTLVMSAVICGGLILSVSVIGMRWSNVDWIHGWRQSIAATQQLGAVNDYGWANAFRDEIVDLKMPLISVVHQPRSLQVIIFAVVLIFGGSYVASLAAILRAGRTPTRRDELLLLSAIWAICLIPIYHRIYDVAFLSAALAWSLTATDDSEVVARRCLLFAMAIFLVPFDIVAAVARRSDMLDRLSHSPVWQTWFAPHYGWAMLASSIGLLFAVWRRASKSTTVQDVTSDTTIGETSFYPSAAAA